MFGQLPYALQTFENSRVGVQRVKDHEGRVGLIRGGSAHKSPVNEHAQTSEADADLAVT